MSDKFIAIVNFHYVRPEKSEQGIHAIAVDEFKNRLDDIHKEGFSFISLEDVHYAVQNQTMGHLKQRSCLISFDDGLKESYDYGLTVLDEKGIPGVFYVVTNAVYQNRVVDVHKMHYVRSQVSDQSILERITKYVDMQTMDVNDEQLRQQYPWDDILAARVKYAFNFLMDEKLKLNVIDDLFRDAYRGSEAEYARNLYMSQDQVKRLAEKKYLGTHSSDHHVLANLDEEALREDIENSMQQIFEHTNQKMTAISYPYGEKNAVNEYVAQCSKSLGLISGMTMFRGVNFLSDIVENPLMLKRLDANDMVGGKSQHVYKEVISEV